MNPAELSRLARQAKGADGAIGRRSISELRKACLGADRSGRTAPTPALVRALLEVERVLRPRMTPGGATSFQTLVAELGARQSAPIDIPENDTPLWLSGTHPLAGFGATAPLPARADIVVVGAGLTGASAAYHLSREAARGRHIVVVEALDPATQASGRNGGNFEVMPENFHGEYEGLPRERQKWLAATRPGLSGEALRRAANEQAAAILRFCDRNTRRLFAIVERERVGCDLSPAGWLRIADTAHEEAALADEVRFARELGMNFELWQRATIRKKLRIPAPFGGRFAKTSGNYHPFKLVNAMLARACRRGIALYTHTPVAALRTGRNSEPVLETNRGAIAARSVIFATNAFTSTLLPELAWVRYYQSQILTLEHVRDPLRGMTVTEKKGDLYYNFPGAHRYLDGRSTPRGTLLVGGGLDREGRNPSKLRRSRIVLDLVKRHTDERFPETRGQPPSRLWTGPMAFTPDRAPALGRFERPGRPTGLVIAAGYNGYGGSYCLEAGHVAALIAVTGKTPSWALEDLFSPVRFSESGG